MSLPASLAEWRQRGSHVTCADRRLFVVDSAPQDVGKTAVLMIHGFPTAGWDWQKLWPLLSPQYRLIAPDMLGFGFSDKPASHDYTIHEQADLLEALVDSLSLSKFHVLAHDYGDTVAQELLSRQNAIGEDSRWLSLSLLNGGLFPETHRARISQKILHGPFGFIATRLMNRGTLARNLRVIFGPGTQPADDEIEAFWQLITANDGKRNFHRLIRYIRDRRQHRERWVGALRDSIVPLQLINGSFDPVSGAHMVSRYRELIGHGDIVELARIGHYPQVEDPAAVAEAYLNFLGKQN